MHADSRIRWFHVFAIVLFSVCSVEAFYIPGWSIKSYRENAAIPLFVNKLYSDKSQLQYAYYDLPFVSFSLHLAASGVEFDQYTEQVCPPTGRKNTESNLVSGHSVSLNLGEVLRGDRIMISDYELEMLKDDECHFLCNREIDRKALRRARELITDGYLVEWIVDNLPGATSFVTVDKSRKYYAAGFKIGYQDVSPVTGKARYFINNHITIVLRVRKAPGKDGEQGRRVIVGFEVYPKSIAESSRNATGCPRDVHHVQDGMELFIASNETERASRYAGLSYEPPDQDDANDGAKLQIPYTYSVYFREEESIEWANRWDLYFVHQEDSFKIHWLAILNSLVIAALLTTVTAVILARTVRGDIKAFPKDGGLEEGKVKLKRKKTATGTRSPKPDEKNAGGLLDQAGDVENDADVSSDEEGLEDVTGWKLLHGDVFRPPPYGGLLAPLIGSGMQLLFMAVGLLALSCLGILNPSFRGGFASVGIGLFVFAGLFSGYFSGRVYKTFGGQNWRKNTLMTAILFPGLLFTLVFILNLFVWAQASSTALPFGTLVGLAALWLFIQLPLVYAGSWLGYMRTGPWEHPTKTNVIPRQIPNQSWYIKSTQGILLAGLLPFAVIFIELMFVFKSLWQDKSSFFYVFGFLAIVSTILILTVIEVTIVTTYIQLCSENYHWWWHSFFVGGGSAAWVFLYCLWYYFTKLHIEGFVSSMLFFSYSFLACAVYGLLTGTVGFLTAYAFVRRIYGAIKAD
ncbi:MAG: hypothetical protein M1825_001905 [Sarcosagium campestre]|nr:MAG: hypothetical protein M1825_001905 [Sarcosagium campestre]